MTRAAEAALAMLLGVWEPGPWASAHPAAARRLTLAACALCTVGVGLIEGSA